MPKVWWKALGADKQGLLQRPLIRHHMTQQWGWGIFVGSLSQRLHCQRSSVSTLNLHASIKAQQKSVRLLFLLFFWDDGVCEASPCVSLADGFSSLRSPSTRATRMIKSKAGCCCWCALVVVAVVAMVTDFELKSRGRCRDEGPRWREARKLMPTPRNSSLGVIGPKQTYLSRRLDWIEQ